MRYLLVILLSAITFGQTASEKAEIVSNYDKEEILQLTSYIQQWDHERLQRVNSYLSATGKSMYQIIDGEKVVVRDVLEDGTVLYYRNYNDGSAMTMRAKGLYPGGSAGLSLTGAGIEVGVWEAEDGIPLLTHEDLVGRITVIDGSNSDSFHATHVVGTIISSGANTIFNQGRGIAYGASVRVANSDSDYTEMTTEATNGMLISNHSYGYGVENVPMWSLGAYVTDSYNIDFICRTFPYYLPVLSAGNDRGDFPEFNPTKGGFDMLNGDKNSKNPITVAAISQVLNYTGPNSVNMSSFSNWGGTDDGRIKPDISAKGVGVYSTSNASNTAYASSQGTSMASPGISGLLALLQEHYNNENGQFMLSATAKGLLLHTADEAGIAQGPDYKFGWGVPNGEKMAHTISENTISSTIEEKTLNAGDVHSFNIIANGTEPLKVSISWTDKPGPTNGGTLDDPTPALVNDLDLKLTKDGSTYYPWKLTVSNYNLPATREGTNDVDNFERVDVDTTNDGDIYNVTISHKDDLDGDSQNYSLIVTGGVVETMGVTDNDLLNQDVTLYPIPAKDELNIKNNSNRIFDRVELITTSGQIVVNQKLEDNKINISNLPQGIYFVRIYTNDGIIHKKIIKD